jgi:large subunit ribosomal protein L9
MKVILQRDMKHLGKIGDIVKVKDGYGRNFLLPRGVAILADEKNQRVLDHQKRVAKSLAAKETAKSLELAEKIKENALSFKMESGDGGKLFGSVTTRDIADALADKGISLDRRKIVLEAPLKEIGRHEVPVSLGHDVTAKIIVFVAVA